MDSTPENSIYHDRHFFLSKLKSNPLFLFSHLPALSGVLWKRYRSKYFIALRGHHKGSKKRPPWLKPLGKLSETSARWDEVLKRIPQRSLTLSPLDQAHDKAYKYHAEGDAEDIFATHRFGELITDLVDKSMAPDALPERIRKWLAHPPSKKDPAWETYSVCERVANLLTWMSFLPADKRSCLPATILDFLQDSLLWIDAHLEWYGTQTGNHILNNARALIMLGSVLHHAKAVQAGLLILQHMLPALIQPEGALRERSTHYQLIVLTWLLDADYFANHADEHADLAFLKDTLVGMLKTAALFCDARGYLQTCIGDISPDASPLTTARRLLACYPRDWPLVLPMQSSQRADDWYALQTKDNKILLNCPMGLYPLTFPSHAHGDISSFVWIHKDEALLIDTGRSRYTKDRVSLLQKSAVGHNIPLVNQFAPVCESLVLHGHWWPLPYARATICVKETADNSLTLSHDGFKRSTPVTQHTRMLSLLNNAVQINDHFQGSGQAHIRLLWQLHPDFTKFDRKTLTLCKADTRIAVDVSATCAAPVIQFFQDHPDIGWCSSQYGYTRSNPVLSIQWKVNLPFTATLMFRIEPCVV